MLYHKYPVHYGREVVLFTKRQVQGVGVLTYKVTNDRQMVLSMERFDPEYRKQVRRCAKIRSIYKHVYSVWEKPEGMVHLALRESTKFSFEEVVEHTIREVIKTLKMTYHRLIKRRRQGKPKRRNPTNNKEYINRRARFNPILT